MPATLTRLLPRSLTSFVGHSAQSAAHSVRHFGRRAIEQFQLRPPQADEQVARLKELTERKLYDQAVPLAEQLIASHPKDRALVQLARATFSKAGALTPLLNALRQERGIRDRPWLAKREAIIEGRLNETSAAWQPVIDQPAEPIVPSSTDRVLHLLKVTAPERQSGYTMRGKYTVEGQLAAGLDPIAMTYLGFPWSAGFPDADPETEIAGVRYTRINAGDGYDFDKPYDQLLTDFANATASRVRDLAPAVVHAHSGFRGYDLAHVGLALGRHFDLPVVYEVRGFFESLWTSDTAWAERSETYQRRLDTETRCMSAVDAVVTLSESMRTEIISRGVAAERVFVVPNGVDVDFFQPRERRHDLVERYQLEGAFTVGYISNLDHYREGQELLIDAVARLRDRGVPARALIVGDGKRRDLLESYARDQGAADIVTFTGKVPHDEVRDYYPLLDVFVVPRVAERAARLVTPLKPYEAMASGIPLVTSDLDALREITGDETRGRCFEAGHAAALASVLAELASDEDGRRAMAKRARDWVVAERQWSTNGRRYAEIYELIT